MMFNQKEYDKLYYQKNEGYIKKRHKKWYDKNRLIILKQKKKYYKKNKTKIVKKCKDYLKQWYIKNKNRLKPMRKEYRKKNWKRIKKQQYLSSLKRNYGLLKKEFQQLIKKQNRKCKICKKQLNNSTRKYQVDHDHKTGKVRGILCFKCNLALGGFEDSIKNLYRAITYIKNTQGKL